MHRHHTDPIAKILMFKKFSIDENVSSTSQIKNSAQRAILADITEQYPRLKDAIEHILPKKNLMVAKAVDGNNNNIQLIIANDEILFYNQRDGPYYPTLKLLHKYPTMMKRMQCDKASLIGAIKFILGGANIMCPGFTSAGGNMPDDFNIDEPVAIYAQGKEHALAIGLTKMSTEQIRTVNKDVAVENIHYLLDGLYQNGAI